MLTKTSFALIAALIFGSAPALAAQTHRHVPARAQSCTNSTSKALGLPRTGGSACDIIVNTLLRAFTEP
jgi:hypothetical protein